jgi:EAL domain-containing protein (putative c-di-GMP-specific phosphodiesterase class I)
LATEASSPFSLTPSMRLLQGVLDVVRGHLRMDVAFISRVADGRRVFEYVAAGPEFRPIVPGGSDVLEDTYCGRVLDGRIPELIHDAALVPEVADLAATWELPVGSHVSTPIRTSDGATYGTLCCFSRAVHPRLTQSDVEVLRTFANVVSAHLEPLVEQQRSTELARERIGNVLDDGGPSMALQPIVDLSTNLVCGYEALARFPRDIAWNPEQWFAHAHRVGMGVALESAAVHAATRLLPRLRAGISLAVNVSAPALLSSASIVELLTGAGSEQLVLEITEHQTIADPDRLAAVLARVRAAEVRIAVDDAGSGYAGLERILVLDPEVLKLDRSLVDGIAHHAGRQAMCEAMVRFTARMGTRLIAEGVETEADLKTLRHLGVGYAQGYLLGRPATEPVDLVQPR